MMRLLRGAAIGAVVGQLFLLLLALYTFASSIPLLGPFEFLTRLYLQLEIPELLSYHYTIAILIHIILSMIFGILAIRVIAFITNFKSLRWSLITGLIYGVALWIILAYIFEPMALGSTGLLNSSFRPAMLVFFISTFGGLFGLIAHGVEK